MDLLRRNQWYFSLKSEKPEKQPGAHYRYKVTHFCSLRHSQASEASPKSRNKQPGATGCHTTMHSCSLRRIVVAEVDPIVVYFT